MAQSVRKKSDNIESIIKNKLSPIESTLISTQEAVKLLEESNKRLESNFNAQLVSIQNSIKELVSQSRGENKQSDDCSVREENSSQNNSEAHNKHDHGLRISSAIPGPEKISETLTLAQFRDWRRKFENYLIFQGVQNCNNNQISALLTTFFTQDISDVVRLVLKFENASSVEYNVILDELEIYFKKKENGRIRRSQFMVRKQEAAEPFMSFYREKLKLFQLTDPCKHCYDRCLADHIIESLFDSNIRKKCRTLPDSIGVDDIVKLCEAEEAAIREEDQNDNQILKINNKFKNKNIIKRKCQRCNNPWHNDYWKECPARNSYCNKCGRKGHFTKYCLVKDVNTVESVDEDISKIGCLNISSIDSKCSYLKSQRQIYVQVQVLQMDPNKYNPFSFYATPDTGAEVCVAGKEFLKKNSHLVHLQPSNIKLESADGSRLKVLGKIQCQIRYEKLQSNVTIHICCGVKELLIDKCCMVDLGLIHKEFPKPLPLAYIKVPQTDNCNFIKEPNDVQIENIKQSILKEYHDVFNSENKLKSMVGKPVHIYLKENAVPYAISCPRKIPFAWRQQVKDEIDEMVKRDIIKPVEDIPTDYVSPLVIVQKPNGKIRICVDFTKLNQYVKRPVHPFKSPWEAVSNINRKSRYFSTLDATSGYWQLSLDEASQKLTTFLTPWGRYMFLRTPMGLVSSGDEYCRRGDEALVNIENIEKVVDDILVHDENFEEHYNRVNQILKRCREMRITLNPSKFVFGKPEVEYVGYRVGHDGIKADPQKIEAIQKFPAPTNISEMRSFLGMVNQLGSFSPKISSLANPLRDLLKIKNQFQWTSVHEEAFKKLCSTLSNPPVLAHFDPTLPTALHTDASRLKGLGYVLLQQHRNGWKMVQCGSRFISDTESRYAMIELELLAITWAVAKCRIYLLGLENFTIVTDHKPLLTILNKNTLDTIENPRIQRLKEKLAGYCFIAEWKRGKENYIADALSRAPVSHPEKEDLLLAEDTTLQINSLVIYQMSVVDSTEESAKISHMQDPILIKLQKIAEEDLNYNILLNQIEKGFPNSKKNLLPELKPYWNIKDELSIDKGLILKGCQIVIPKSARKMVLERLHDSHQGIERTKRRARQTVFWPAMNSDIQNMIEICESCQILRPSLQKEIMMCDPLPTRPFQDVSVDLFKSAGKHFMVYVDRLSGWPVICNYGNRDPTSYKIISDMRKIFSDTGVPIRLRSDNGPQFASFEFKNFLKKWNVTASPSTPYYPQSNGHAEAAVKAMKHLIIKSVDGGVLNDDKYYAGLLEWRNTPKDDGRSPAQILFGHPLRSLVPAHHKSFAKEWQMCADVYDYKASQYHKNVIKTYNKNAKKLSYLPIGTSVRLQNPITKLWDQVGVIVEIGKNRDYIIKTASGRVYRRNRRFIRKSYLERNEEEGIV